MDGVCLYLLTFGKLIITPSGVVYCGSSPDPPLIQRFTKVNDTVSKLTPSRTIAYSKWKRYTSEQRSRYYWSKYNVLTTYKEQITRKLNEKQNYSLSSVNEGYWSRRKVSMDPGGDEYTFDKSTGIFTLNPDKTVYNTVWDHATHGPHTIGGPYYRYIYIVGTYAGLNITSVYDPPEDEFENPEYDYTINGTFRERSGTSLVYFYASSYVNSVGTFYISEITSVKDSTSKGDTSYGNVSSLTRNQYPDNGESGGYWYVYSTSAIEYYQGSYVDEVVDINSSKYPSNGRYSDGYWYVKVA